MEFNPTSKNGDQQSKSNIQLGLRFDSAYNNTGPANLKLSKFRMSWIFPDRLQLKFI